jgi:hypothetical protein
VDENKDELRRRRIKVNPTIGHMIAVTPVQIFDNVEKDRG